MEYITTLKEAAEFVNQFVDIHDFTYDVPSEPGDLRAAGFVKCGSQWSTGVIVYDSKRNYYRYSVDGITVTTTFRNGRYTSNYQIGGMYIQLDHYAGYVSPPAYENIHINNEDAGVKVKAFQYRTIVKTPFVDADDSVLTVERFYNRDGTLFSTKYENSMGYSHCKSGPSMTFRKSERYYLNGHYLSKAKWNVLRKLPNWTPDADDSGSENEPYSDVDSDSDDAHLRA